MKLGKSLLNGVAIGVASLGLIAGLPSPAVAQESGHKEKTGDAHKPEHKQEEKNKDSRKQNEPVTAGSIAPDFTLPDLTGKTYKLSELTRSGKTVVLMWFNPDCPYVVKHFTNASTFNDIVKNYAEKNVVLLAINSGAPGKQGAGLERNKKAADDWKINFPILLDESGNVGRAYSAKRTPEMFVINKDGYIAYHGAIDDDAGTEKIGKTNYVTKALDSLLAGKEVETKTSKPYGCTVKY
jgi:peroxiredoxin